MPFIMVIRYCVQFFCVHGKKPSFTIKEFKKSCNSNSIKLRKSFQHLLVRKNTVTLSNKILYHSLFILTCSFCSRGASSFVNPSPLSLVLLLLLLLLTLRSPPAPAGSANACDWTISVTVSNLRGGAYRYRLAMQRIREVADPGNSSQRLVCGFLVQFIYG